jgi:hypothetical protein
MSTNDANSIERAEAPTVGADTTDDETDDPEARLERTAARAELLAEENQRLRTEYARARQSRYRRTSIGLAAIGLLAVAAGVVLPAAREVLLTLGATGVFGALLTYYLTPGRFVTASVGERVYAAWAANGAAIAAELGLRDEHRYVPDVGGETARLYVPLHAGVDPPRDHPGPIALEETERGLVLVPTGATLFEEFRRALAGDLATNPEPLATQLCDGLVEQFELVDRADSDVDTAGGRVTIAVSGSAFGAVDRFDHPIGSFVAVGLAVGLGRTMTLETEAGDDRADWLVTCRFETDSDPDDGSRDDEPNDTLDEAENEA